MFGHCELLEWMQWYDTAEEATSKGVKRIKLSKVLSNMLKRKLVSSLNIFSMEVEVFLQIESKQLILLPRKFKGADRRKTLLNATRQKKHAYSTKLYVLGTRSSHLGGKSNLGLCSRNPVEPFGKRDW